MCGIVFVLLHLDVWHNFLITSFLTRSLVVKGPVNTHSDETLVFPCRGIFLQNNTPLQIGKMFLRFLGLVRSKSKCKFNRRRGHQLAPAHAFWHGRIWFQKRSPYQVPRMSYCILPLFEILKEERANTYRNGRVYQQTRSNHEPMPIKLIECEPKMKLRWAWMEASLVESVRLLYCCEHLLIFLMRPWRNALLA